MEYILNAIADCILIIDNDHKIVFANRAMLDYCGVSLEKIVGKRCYEFFHNSQFPCKDVDICPHKEVFSTGKSMTVNHAHVLPTSREVIVEITASPIKNEKAEVIEIVEVVRDVTEISKNKERLNAIINTTPNVAIEGYDINGRILYWNKAAENIFGWTEKEALGKTLDQLILDKESANEFLSILRDVEKSNKPFGPSEWKFKSKEGVEGTVYSTIFPIPSIWAKKEFICMDVDITERKKTEEKLRDSESFISSVLDSIGDALVVIDRDFKIILANQGYLTQTKNTLDEIIGKHCYELSHRIQRPCYERGEECTVKHVFETGKHHIAIHTHYDKEGNPIYVEANSYPFKDASGSVVYAIETIKDITEKVKLENELKNRIKELEEFYNMAIGRELKMTELKDEIEKLKEELKKAER